MWAAEALLRLFTRCCLGQLGFELRQSLIDDAGGCATRVWSLCAPLEEAMVCTLCWFLDRLHVSPTAAAVLRRQGVLPHSGAAGAPAAHAAH
jgi:hypothetical protein